MAQLVTCIGEGKGTWGHVARVINESDWSGIYIVTTEYFKDKFKTEKQAKMIVVDKEKSVPDIVAELHKEFEGKISGDVSVNLISGSGKEHMAILSSLMRLGIRIKLVAFAKDGVKEI